MRRPGVVANIADVPVRNAHTPRFERFVTRHRHSPRLALFTRAAGNGQVRHFIQVPPGKVAAFHAAFGVRQRVVGLFCVRHREADHLYLRLGCWTYHLLNPTSRTRGSFWIVNDHGRRERFEEMDAVLTERLLQLERAEFDRLRAHARALQQRSRRDGALAGFAGNCVNAWMSAPVGRGDATLARVAGIDEEDFGPEVMRQLLQCGNERVLGVAVYPPRGRAFRRFERTRDPF